VDVNTLIYNGIIIVAVVAGIILYCRIRGALDAINEFKIDKTYLKHLEQENEQMRRMLVRQNLYLKNDNNDCTG
jgi:hypothetical protein